MGSPSEYSTECSKCKGYNISDEDVLCKECIKDAINECEKRLKKDFSRGFRNLNKLREELGLNQ